MPPFVSQSQHKEANQKNQRQIVGDHDCDFFFGIVVIILCWRIYAFLLVQQAAVRLNKSKWAPRFFPMKVWFMLCQEQR